MPTRQRANGRKRRPRGTRAPIDAEPPDRCGPLLVEDQDQIVDGRISRVRDRHGPRDPEAESVGGLAERDAQHLGQTTLTEVERDGLPGGAAQGRQKKQMSQSHAAAREVLAAPG